MANISRRDLVLIVIGLDENGELSDSLGGITRLQKFLFLLEKEHALTPTGDGFEFAAYKAGPYSSKLYDDLEFLENLDLIGSEVQGEATEEEASEIDLLDFDELMGDGADVTSDGRADGFGASDAYEEHRFSLTENGKKKIEELIDSGDYEPIVDGIRKVKSKYGNFSLNDLLYHVYTKYPEMTSESDIKDKVLSRKLRK